MDTETAAWIMELLRKKSGDREKLAKWFRYSLKLGSLIDCRIMINDAINHRETE